MRKELETLSWLSVAVLLSVLLNLASPASALAEDRNTVMRATKVDPIQPRREPLKRAKTALIDFETAPFPYDGIVPGTDTSFLNVIKGERKGHFSRFGHVFWADETYRERRVLLHIPKGYDFTRPGVMIVFFHGHGATLRRDVRDRQMVPAQISASGINAVLVAPQFAFNAPDSSVGKFWEPGAFGQFVEEAAKKLAELHGNPLAAQAFADMPIVIVAYSGGYLATASCLEVGGVETRVRGVVLLDALYGELDKFAAWISNNRTTFFVSAYTESTERKHTAFKTMLTEQEIPFGIELKKDKWKQGVTFLSTNPEIKHEDFVTEAWVEFPIRDILRRLDEYKR